MKKLLKNIDKQLLFLTIVLFSFGLIMIYSASNVTAFYLYNAGASRYFFKQGIFLLLGVIISFILVKFNTKKYRTLSILGTTIFTILIAFLVLYGTVTNGSKNWLGIDSLGIQPSEFIKVMIIPLMAIYYEKYQEENSIKILLPFILFVFIFILIILQNDYGTALIFILIPYLLFFFTKAKKKYKSLMFLTGVAGVALLSLLIIMGKIPESKMTRLKSNIEPCKIENYLNEGNQLCNSYIAINSGGIFGKGLGNSTQKYLYLPEAYTDYIFAIVVEELGLVGGVAVIALYFLVILRIIKIGKKAHKLSHSLICYGTAIYIFLHIVINLFGVLGIIPLTGIPLPFMSYGGSFAWSLIIALTMVQRVNYETNLKKS